MPPSALLLPLRFRAIYHNTVWGGRRMATWRDDLPAGPVGESWDLADHARGMSVVEGGALAGRTLRDLTAEFAQDLVGDGFTGGDFPLMVKLIDASDRLSIQVHPDDELARVLAVGARGKTECWLMVGDGGEVFIGVAPGCDRDAFAAALAAGTVADQLNRFPIHDGDFFHLPARTVHALGAGCLVYEVQQTCDVTFRVDDWGRLGLDGRPRPLHVDEALQTIDFSPRESGPVQVRTVVHAQGGSVRRLAANDFFTVEEHHARSTGGGNLGSCTVVTCLSGRGTLTTDAGPAELSPMRTLLVPACAGAWRADAAPLHALRLLVATPVL